MTFKGASENSVLLFMILILAIIFAGTIGTYFANRKSRPLFSSLIFFACMMIWLIADSAIVASGTLAAAPMPWVLLFFLGNNIIALLLAFSPFGEKLARRLPLAALVGFQAFRLPLELILHEWAEQQVIPETMTWTGANFDIISGIVALIAAPLASRFKPAGWIANVVGFFLLLNVARVAVMSSPLPFAWDVTPPLQLAFFLPYAWIIPFCVGGALAGHVILTRALMKESLY